VDGGEVFYALNFVRVDVIVETFGVLNKCCGQCPGYDKFLSFLRSVSGRDAPKRYCCDLFSVPQDLPVEFYSVFSSQASA
jgi:hypothetical protein